MATIPSGVPMSHALRLVRLRHGSMRTGQVPIIGCDVSPEAWMGACSIPLYSNRWNEWYLIRTLDDQPTTTELLDRARNTLKFWFSKTAKIPGFTLGHADNLSVSLVQPPQLLLPTSPGRVSRIAKTWTDCPSVFDGEPVGVRGMQQGHYATVRARFVYRGAESRMPWPAARTLPKILGPGTPETLTAEWCPVDATWLVTAALEPDAKEFVPEPTGELDLGDAFAKPVKEITSAIKWGVVGVIAVAVIALAT